MNLEEFYILGPSGNIFVTVFGRSSTVQTKASLPPLVLVHPVNTGSAVWTEVAMNLAEDRVVYVLDLRGHGKSTPHGPYTVIDYVADVTTVLDHFKLDQCHVAGGSIGGPVSVVLAATLPDRILSIASFGGALKLYLSDEAYIGLKEIVERDGNEALIRMLVPEALSPARRTAAMSEKAIAISLSEVRNDQVVLDIIRQAFGTDVTNFANRCHVPSLIVNGVDDATCTPEQGVEMARLLRGTAVTLKDVGHLPMLEAPLEVVHLLRNHYKTIEKS